MKKVTVNKKAMVQAPAEDFPVVGYQMVEFVIDFFGNEIICIHDTRIMEDGSQFVIGGDGYIAHDYEVI